MSQPVKRELMPAAWIEVAQEGMLFKSHYHQWSSIWFSHLTDAHDWIIRARHGWEEPQPKISVDTPREPVVKSH